MTSYYQTNGVPGGVATAAAYANGERIWGKWRISSAGPDRNAGPYPTGAYVEVLVLYDPTNGTVSTGDIVRSQRLPDGPQPPY